MNENPYRSSEVPHAEPKAKSGLIGCLLITAVLFVLMIGSLFFLKVKSAQLQTQQADEAARQAERRAVELETGGSQ